MFFATLPPDPLRPVIVGLGSGLRRANRLHGAMISNELLHNTVAPAFNPRWSLEKTIEQARRIGAQTRYPSFEVEYDRTRSFDVKSDRYPFVLSGDEGLASLKAVRQDLRKRMVRAGFIVPQSYTPHVTMMWAERYVDENPIAPIGWRVRDLVLVLSLRGFGQHYYAGQWRLG